MSSNEIEIQNEWKTKEILQKYFESQLNKSNKFVTFDGPPFLSGKMHSGTALVSTIKDTYLRFKSVNGNNVISGFGYDCNGVPIEMKIMSLLNLKSPQDVVEYGINRFNEKCKEFVNNCGTDFTDSLFKLGRWVNLKNEYRTMHTNYKESVWWSFSQIYKKNLVHIKKKIVAYSIGCSCSFSNFEATQNYKEVSDLSLIVKFKLQHKENEYFLVWTTTPWTLISNLAICTNKSISFVKIQSKSNKEIYYTSLYKFESLTKNVQDNYILLENNILGEKFENIKYNPLWNYFENEFKSVAFKVVLDDFVSNTSGTGFVHLAPAYGEDDLRVCTYKNIIHTNGDNINDCINDNGCYLNNIEMYKSRYIFDCNKEIEKFLKSNNQLFSSNMFKHSYPFCYRTNTPLIYRACKNVYISTTKLKSKLINNCEKITWIPPTKQMRNWLENVQDWCVSRSRFWGTPIPLWISDCGDVICFSSKQEIELEIKCSLKDLSKEYTDEIVILKNGKKYKSCKFVFDCWYESGCMPFAQHHYPFENKEKFESNMQADFISESSDQVRGWFYTLHVISTALFDIPAYKKVLVTGMVLDKNGNKMSKSLGNYIDPNILFEKYSSDAFRLYILQSGAAKNESFKFNSDDIQIVNRNILQRWSNSTKFLYELYEKYINTPNYNIDTTWRNKSSNIMDIWIIECVNNFKFTITNYLNTTIDFPKCIKEICDFLELLSNWYIRMNRLRIKGKFGFSDLINSHTTLYYTLYIFTCVMSIFTPHMSEIIYNKLNKIKCIANAENCVHFLQWYQIGNEYPCLKDYYIKDNFNFLKIIVEITRKIRDKNLKFFEKKYINDIVIVHSQENVLNNLRDLNDYLLSECHCLHINYKLNNDHYRNKYIINSSNLKKTLSSQNKLNNWKVVTEKINSISSQEQLNDYLSNGISVDNYNKEVGHVTITENDIQINIEINDNQMMKEFPLYKYDSQDGFIVALNSLQTKEIKEKNDITECVVKIQKIRKDNNLLPKNKIKVSYYHELLRENDIVYDNLSSLEKLLDCEVMLLKKNNISNYIGSFQHEFYTSSIFTFFVSLK